MTQAVTPDLITAANKADDVANQIVGNLNTLLTQLEPLDKDFQGGGGDSFKVTKGKVEIQLRKIVDALKEVAEGVKSSGTHFDVSDTEAKNLVDKAMHDTSIIDQL